MWNFIKDVWFLFGRLFPFPTKPGLRRVGSPGRSSPVLVTCNFELTVRKLTESLQRDEMDAWLLVAPTKGINVWCAAGGGHFSTDAVVSIVRTSGIEELVDHRNLVLPQLSASGVNLEAVKERTAWKPRFGPANFKDLSAYLRSGKARTQRQQRHVEFGLQDRFVMGTNLGFNAAVILVIPLLIASIWVSGLWWKTLPLLLLFSVACTVLVYWIPGKVGLQKGVSVGLLAAAVFVLLAQTLWELSPWAVAGWAVWIVVVAAYVGYDMPGWSPLWRQQLKQTLLGIRVTHVEIIAEKCINCHMCDVVCPADVFARNVETKKYEVVNLDGCLACGACIENCPTDAIANNFRKGVCACPTCSIIKGAGALRGKLSSRQESNTLTVLNSAEPAADCDLPNCDCHTERAATGQK